MFMECINVFNKSIRGASHLANGKPCQDYSISFSENGVQILVVCDWTWSETYLEVILVQISSRSNTRYFKGIL